MSQVLTFEMKGLKQLEENLRRLRSDVAAKWVNGGLLAGTKVIAVRARGNVPVKSGLLKQSIRTRRGKKTDDNKRDYFVVAGSRKAGGGGAYYAHIVERGAKPHIIKGKGGGMLYFGGHYARSVKHPGVKNPTHFLESALRTEAQAAIGTFAGYIRAKLAKAGMLNPDAETE